MTAFHLQAKSLGFDNGLTSLGHDYQTLCTALDLWAGGAESDKKRARALIELLGCELSPKEGFGFKYRIVERKQEALNLKAVSHELLIGIDSFNEISAGTSATISTMPAIRFRLQAFIVLGNGGPLDRQWMVNSARLGVEPVLGASGSVVIVSGQRLMLPPLLSEVGQTFSVTFTNITGQPLRFTGILVGISL